MGEICSKCFRIRPFAPHDKTSSNREVIDINIPVQMENIVKVNFPFQSFYNENVILDLK